MLKTDILNRFRYKSINTVKHMKNLIYPNAVILMYHRVEELDSDPWSLAVTPKHFAEHLEIIRKIGNPLSLQQLRSRLNKKQSVTRSIVITFDDGYADNLYNAKPLLEKYDIPATFFVTTSAINKQGEFWWDELDRILMQPYKLPGLLQLNLQGKRYQWLLDEETDDYKENFKSNHRDYCMNKKPKNYSNKRQIIYGSVYELLHSLTVDERNQVLNELSLWVNNDHHYSFRETHRPLSCKEMISLDDGKLVEIGAHTVSHPLLSDLSINLQRDEITKSKNYLENILGQPVNSFAYPHGSYNNATISIVKEAKFNCACSSLIGRVKSNNDPFLLPRLVVKDWDGESFYKWLSKKV